MAQDIGKGFPILYAMHFPLTIVLVQPLAGQVPFELRLLLELKELNLSGNKLIGEAYALDLVTRNDNASLTVCLPSCCRVRQSFILRVQSFEIYTVD